MKRWVGIGILLGVAALGAEDWVEVAHSPEITVYRKEIPGDPLFAYRGDATISAPMDKVVSVVTDSNRRAEWAERVKEARILKQISPTERIEYLVTRVPWPLKDRDFVLHTRLIPDRTAKTLRILVESTDFSEMPENPKYVRGFVKQADFVLSSINGGKSTRVLSESHVDPKGSIPAWVINMIQKSFPRKSVANLTRQVSRPDIVSSPLVAEYGLMQ